MSHCVESAPPPLTGWQVIWRNLFAVVGGGLIWLTTAPQQWAQARWLFWTDLVLGIAAIAAMQYRRRWPVEVTWFTALATALSAAAIGAWTIAEVSLSTRRRWREIVPTAALSLATGLVFNAVEPTWQQSWYANLLYCSLSTGVVVAIGLYVGARRDLVVSRRDRAARAVREQALQVASARAHERTRIAREMHDVLAHRMSLVAVHAGALAYRTDLTAGAIRQTAEIIQANSQRALTDLREILGLLRDTERGVDVTNHRPQPTLGDLDTLLADERAAGAHVDLTSGVEDLRALPESTGRSAFRIIQEGLTNARKHAPDAAVTVALAGRPGDGLSLEVRNPMRVSADHSTATVPGFGLVGLAERAAASHGRFEHGLTADGDFLVRAWLPWQR